MKVFVYATHNLWPSHPETELEIIQTHLDSGDEVIRFVCNGELPICDTNPLHLMLGCLRCRDIGQCGKQQLSKDITDLPLLHTSAAIKKKIKAHSFQYNTIQELIAIKVENFDLGYATLSSVISLLREPTPDIQKNREIFDNFLYSSLAVYYSSLEYLKEHNPGVVYIFNARLAHVRPVLKACDAMGIQCLVHERGHDKDHYALYENTMPHDIKYVVSEMYKAWNNADLSTREQVGSRFYEERVSGKEQGWYSFVTSQKKGLLPDNWDASKRNIAIFNSSDDEFAAIGPEWMNPVYTSQNEGIRRIIEDSREHKDIHYYLRVHPNLSNVENTQIAELNNIAASNLTIIHSDSPVNTYDLVRNCEKAVSFGSTVGIEAVYFGTPSILAGISYFYHFNDDGYKPKTHEELMEMVFAAPKPADKTSAYIFGYYLKTFGIPFKYYEPLGLDQGLFNKVNVMEAMSTSTKFFNKLRGINGINTVTSYMQDDFKKNKKKIYIPYIK